MNIASNWWKWFSWFQIGKADPDRKETPEAAVPGGEEPDERRSSDEGHSSDEGDVDPSEEDSGGDSEGDSDDDPGEDPAEDPTPSPMPSLPALPLELHYLGELIRHRLTAIFQSGSTKGEPPMPEYERWELPLGKFILDYNTANTPLTVDETRLLLIALAHHVQPDLFDHSIDSMLRGAGEFPRVGGARGKNFRGFMPTGETALFLLAGEDWRRRLEIERLFWADRLFAEKKILWLEDIGLGEPSMSGRIILSQDYVDIFAHNKAAAPHYSMSFPARVISTQRERDQLVIDQVLNGQLEDLLDWIRFKEEVEKGMENGKFRHGYRSLFYGPSGTGKTFAACILGKETGKEVYRIDLSMVVSKYIGETEKNLEVIFARAENKQWILFFDEADALFGKRTNIRDAHDKYANQEVSYLLQRIEDYDGLVILATNMKNNIDEAFIRRFNSVLKFSIPDTDERKKIWRNSFPKDAIFRWDVPVAAVAAVAEIAGADAVDAATAAGPSPAAHRDRRKERQAAGFYRYAPVNDSDSEAGALLLKAETPDIPEIVKKYVMTGANIQNAVHYASIKGARRQTEERGHVSSPLVIYLPDVIDGIKRELGKDGVPFV